MPLAARDHIFPIWFAGPRIHEREGLLWLNLPTTNKTFANGPPTGSGANRKLLAHRGTRHPK